MPAVGYVNFMTQLAEQVGQALGYIRNVVNDEDSHTQLVGRWTRELRG